MPTASRNVRKARRIKRENTLLYRMVHKLSLENKQLREILTGVINAQANRAEPKQPSLTITKIEEDNVTEGSQLDSESQRETNS